MVAFLRHLEFCQEISESEVSLITTRHFRCSYGPVESFFLIPALVSEERPSEAGAAIETPSYKCGWILQCSQPHQFLTPQFLHVLLVRLAFSFALAPDTHEVQTSPVLERRCCVWTNGICWLNRKGVETTVEVTEQSTVVSLTISCLTGREMECVKHRSQVIKCILETSKEELSPVVTMKESLINPGCLTPPTIRSSLHSFSLSELAEVLVEEKSVLVSQPGKAIVEVEQLLHFEPYSCFSVETLEELFAEENSGKIVSEIYLSKTAHTRVNQLKQVLLSIKLQRVQPGYRCEQVFQVWKENTQTPTYSALRSALDKYSVFCGRNPLVSVCVCVCVCVCALLFVDTLARYSAQQFYMPTYLLWCDCGLECSLLIWTKVEVHHTTSKTGCLPPPPLGAGWLSTGGYCSNGSTSW